MFVGWNLYDLHDDLSHIFILIVPEQLTYFPVDVGLAVLVLVFLALVVLIVFISRCSAQCSSTTQPALLITGCGVEGRYTRYLVYGVELRDVMYALRHIGWCWVTECWVALRNVLWRHGMWR